jgi:hypothetical protein
MMTGWRRGEPSQRPHSETQSGPDFCGQTMPQMMSIGQMRSMARAARVRPGPQERPVHPHRLPCRPSRVECRPVALHDVAGGRALPDGGRVVCRAGSSALLPFLFSRTVRCASMYWRHRL